MPVTEYKRFQTLVDSDGWDLNDPTAFLDGNSDALVLALEGPTLTDPPYAILKNPVNFGVPLNATITGVEINLTIGASNAKNLDSNQVWDGELALTTLTEGDLTDPLITISPDDNNRVATNFSIGGDGNLLGLNLTPSNLSNLQLGFKLATLGSTTIINLGVFGEQGDGSGALAIPSPAVRIYYTTPPSSESFRPGPNFITLNSDLTKKKELKNKNSNLLQPPPNPTGGIPKNLDTFGFGSDDLFGFSQNSTQKANIQSSTSPFGNPSKLGASRSVDSSAGLLDTSKAPITVRKGFQGF